MILEKEKGAMNDPWQTEGPVYLKVWLQGTGRAKQWVAAKTGDSPGNVTRWLAGTRRPAVNSARRLQALTGISTRRWGLPKLPDLEPLPDPPGHGSTELARWMNATGCTPHWLAKDLGVAPGVVQSWRNAITAPTQEQARQIRAITKGEVSHWLRYADEPEVDMALAISRARLAALVPDDKVPPLRRAPDRKYPEALSAIRQWCAHTGTTHAALAQRLHVPPSTLSRWLQGVHRPPLPIAQRFKGLMQIPTALWGYTETPAVLEDYEDAATPARALRKWCKQQSMTQMHLAQALGVSGATVHHWLKGDTLPHRSHANAIEELTHRAVPARWWRQQQELLQPQPQVPEYEEGDEDDPW